MKIKLSRLLLLAGVSTMLCLGNQQLLAQERPGRGNFDQEQMRARVMERYREQLGVEKDDEWQLIQARVQKVSEARRELNTGGGMAFMFGRQGARPGGDADRQGGQRRGGRFGAEANPEADALQKAIEAKASADEIKAKLAKYRQVQKEKEAALEKAQKELKDVLSVRQEAAAVLMGLLD